MASYLNHFQKIKQQKAQQQKKSTRFSLSYQTSRPKKSSSPIQLLGLICLILFVLSLMGFLYPEKIVTVLSSVKINFFSEGMASESAEVAAPKVNHEEKSADSEKKEAPVSGESKKDKVESKTSNIDQLLEKEKELVEREKRVAEMEEKLQQSKLELDEKLKQLDQARRDIASKLETRVVQDQESIDKLVGVYTNMKPQSAAMVISKLDEELAITVLKKMKKQDAGNILNFMDAQKAKVLSEKYSGY